MLISKYGIVLKRLKKEDIELLRQKRNNSIVNDYMFEQREISPAQQEIWFESVNNIHNLYFLILYNNKPVGLINAKNIDFDALSSEGGIFLWESDLWSTYVPVAASLILNDYGFLLGGFNKSFARIRSNNVRALKYNKMMGYMPLNDHEAHGDNEVLLVLTREAHVKYGARIRKGLALLTGDKTPLAIHNFSLSDDGPGDFEKLYNPMPLYLHGFILKVLQNEGKTWPMGKAPGQ